MLLLSSLTAAAVARAPIRRAPTPSWCIVGDGRDIELRDWAVRLATAPTGSLDAAERDSLRIPAAAARTIAIVADTRTCEKAGRAMSATIRAGSTTRRRVYVIRAGTDFVVVDPTLRGGNGGGAVFSGEWVFRESFM